MESFIENPNLPNGKVSLFVVDGRIPGDMERKLLESGARLIKTGRIDGVLDAVSYHPDIMLHHLGDRQIVVAPNISDELYYALEHEGFEIILGERRVFGKYPGDVPYNAARFGKYVICNKKYADPVLLNNFSGQNLILINVKQGYAKCSLCIVDDNAVITSDRGLHNILIVNGIDSLLITQGNIDLFGMNYGFIGGASGLLSRSEIGFYGNLTEHPDNRLILSYLKKYEKKSINLSENCLLDLGTLIPLKEYSILMP